MFNLSISDGILALRPLTSEHIVSLHSFYDDPEHYRYATGFNKCLPDEIILLQLSEVARSDDMFYSGIFYIRTGELVGAIKGKLRYSGAETIYISSLMISRDVQRQGFGSAVIRMIFSYLLSKQQIKQCVVAVAQSNLQGLAFWTKNGFIAARSYRDHVCFSADKETIYVLERTF